MNESIASIPVTTGSLDALRKTRPWVRFLGIMSIIGAALVGLDALINAAAFTGLAAYTQANPSAPAVRAMSGSILVVFAYEVVIFVLFAVFHLRYAGEIRRITNAEGSAQSTLDDVLVAQRKLWVLMGALMLVGLIVGLGFTIFALIIGFHFPSSMFAFPH